MLCLKISIQIISRIPILIPTLFFEFSTLKPFSSKFRLKKSKLFVLHENCNTEYLDDADSYSDISFLNIQPLIRFRENLGRRSQSCPLWLKIGAQTISRNWFFVPTLVFSISNPEPIFGGFWVEKVKVVCFTWRLACSVSRGGWFLFQH